MSKYADFHLHCRFSSDSEAAPEAMIQQAAALGLPCICFTDHNDFDYPPEDGKTVFQLPFGKYVHTLSALSAYFAEKIPVYIGVEQGLSVSAAGRINQYDAEHQLDFIIGSSHLVHGADPYYPAFWENRPTRQAVRTYFESILENVRVCTNFDVYGHLDYIIRYVPEKDNGYDWHTYQEIIDCVLKTLIAGGKGIEVNTAGLRSGLKNPNPCFGVLKRYHELGGEILTIGSDAHAPQHIAGQFEQLGNLLENAGFRYYTIFKHRKPEFIKV